MTKGTAFMLLLATCLPSAGAAPKPAASKAASALKKPAATSRKAAAKPATPVVPVPKGGLLLVRDGKSDYVISVPKSAPPAVRHGAEEIQLHLQKMSGAKLPIVTEAKTKRAIVLRVDPALSEEELRLRTQPPALTIAGGGKRGTMYGCYALLQDVLGCRWFNSRVSFIPKRKTIALTAFDIRQKPAFEYREPYYTEALDRDWAARNRVNGNFEHLDAAVGGHLVYYPFVHTFDQLVPPGQYFATHPEYFSMVNGQRVPNKQLCLTNPDVLRISVERVKQWIREHPEATIFSVSQNDTYGNCECPNCKAVEAEEGAPSGVLLRFVNAVADEVGKEYPNVLIDTLAYQWSEKPPLHVKPHKNVRIRIAPINACFAHGLDQCDANKAPLDNLNAWSKITDQLYVWHYSTNFANYLQPLPDLYEIARDIPLFREKGVVGLFYEGDYAPGGGGEMSELKAYVMAKKMWDPSATRPVAGEYLQGVYGAAAPLIGQWLDILHAPAQKDKSMQVHIYDPPTAPYLSDDTLAKGDKIFDAAEKSVANDPVALDEVQRARLALEYVELMRSTGAAHDMLAKTVAGKIRKYGIGQVREGEPVEAFLKRIGQG